MGFTHGDNGCGLRRRGVASDLSDRLLYRDLIDYILIIYAILGVKFTLGANVKQSHETGTPLETPSIKYYCMATRAAVACGGKS